MARKEVNTCDVCKKDKVANHKCVVCGKDVCDTHSKSYSGKIKIKFFSIGDAWNGKELTSSKKQVKMRACKTKCGTELNKRIKSVEDKAKTKMKKIIDEAMLTIHDEIGNVVEAKKGKKKKKDSSFQDFRVLGIKEKEKGGKK